LGLLKASARGGQLLSHPPSANNLVTKLALKL